MTMGTHPVRLAVKRGVHQAATRGVRMRVVRVVRVAGHACKVVVVEVVVVGE